MNFVISWAAIQVRCWIFSERTSAYVGSSGCLFEKSFGRGLTDNCNMFVIHVHVH